MSEDTTGSHTANIQPEMNNVVPQKRDTYFDEDFEIPDNEEILVSEKNLGFIQQDEDIVMWSIEGFYTDEENTKRKNRLQLKSSPPIFTIQKAGYAPESFYLTQKLANELFRALDTVNRGYQGLPEKDNREKLTVDSTVKWVKEHKVTSGIIVVFILFIILSQFIQF